MVLVRVMSEVVYQAPSISPEEYERYRGRHVALYEGKIIVTILAKIKDALKSPFVRRMETYGVEKAWNISRIAVEWGHEKAGGWARERGFAKYLTVLELNAPIGWGV